MYWMWPSPTATYGNDHGTTTTGFSTNYGYYGQFTIFAAADDETFLDEFSEALEKCHDALRELLVPWLRALRRPRRVDMREPAGDHVPFAVVVRGRLREIRHKRGVMNFYKVKP